MERTERSLSDTLGFVNSPIYCAQRRQPRLNLRHPLLRPPNPPLQVFAPGLAGNGSVFQLVPIGGQLSYKPVAFLLKSLALSEGAGHQERS